MPAMPPQPVVQALVLCREIWEVNKRREIVLVGPCSSVGSRRFPARIPISIFAHLTDARGRYGIGLQLVDSDGQIAWTMSESLIVEEDDPLLPHRIVLRDMRIAFPCPGKYDVELLGNGMVLAHHSIAARLIEK